MTNSVVAIGCGARRYSTPSRDGEHDELPDEKDVDRPSSRPTNDVSGTNGSSTARFVALVITAHIVHRHREQLAEEFDDAGVHDHREHLLEGGVAAHPGVEDREQDSGDDDVEQRDEAEDSRSPCRSRRTAPCADPLDLLVRHFRTVRPTSRHRSRPPSDAGKEKAADQRCGQDTENDQHSQPSRVRHDHPEWPSVQVTTPTNRETSDRGAVRGCPLLPTEVLVIEGVRRQGRKRPGTDGIGCTAEIRR